MMTKKYSFIDIINQHIESGKIELPVFNTSAMRVQQELVKKDPEIKKIEKLISVDQSLSSEILKTANSAFYKGLTEILTIRDAIVRLGMQEIGRISLLAASRNQFRSSDKLLNILMRRLWQHSVGCALGANWLAKRCKMDDIAEHAFFAGLLHDVGKLFVILVLEHIKRKDKDLQYSQALLFEAMKSLHTEQGFNLMQQWNMPLTYCTAVRDHHNEKFDTKDSLLILVRLSNLVCNTIGIGAKSQPDLSPSTTLEANLLNVTEIDLAELEIKLEDISALAG